MFGDSREENVIYTVFQKGSFSRGDTCDLGAILCK